MAVGNRSRQTKKELFLQTYDETFNVTKACKAANIARDTFYQWLKRYPKFKARVDAIEESVPDLAEEMLRKNVDKGMQRAIEFDLANRRREKYQDTRRTEIAGQEDEPIRIVFVREKEETPPQNGK